MRPRLNGRRDAFDGVFVSLRRGQPSWDRSRRPPRLELRAALLLSTLPPWAQVLLSGRPPVRVDGQTLELEVQLALSLLKRWGAPPLETLPLVEAREAYRRRLAVSNGPPTRSASPLPATARVATPRRSRRGRRPGTKAPHPSSRYCSTRPRTWLNARARTNSSAAISFSPAS